MSGMYELIAPCHFGLEAVLKKEIMDLGYAITLVEDGRVTFTGGEDAICRANVFLRTAERVLLKAGSFRAETFEELFQGTKDKGNSLGGVYPGRWKILGGKGVLHQEQTVQPVGYPVHHEEGYGGAAEEPL